MTKHVGNMLALNKRTLTVATRYFKRVKSVIVFKFEKHTYFRKEKIRPIIISN